MITPPPPDGRPDRRMAEELIDHLARVDVTAYEMPLGNGITVVSLWQGVVARTDGTHIWWRYSKSRAGRGSVEMLTWARTPRVAAARLRWLYLWAASNSGRHREATDEQRLPT
jgi:hypothetical protein